jgi:WD40 repeat protein
MAVSAGYNGLALAATINIADVAKSVTVKYGKKQIDVTAISDAADEYIMGRGSASGTITVPYDAAHTGVTALINGHAAGTAVALDIGPASTLHYQFSSFITNMSFDNDGSDLLTLVFDYVSSGTITKATS